MGIGARHSRGSARARQRQRRPCALASVPAVCSAPPSHAPSSWLTVLPWDLLLSCTSGWPSTWAAGSVGSRSMAVPATLELVPAPEGVKAWLPAQTRDQWVEESPAPPERAPWAPEWPAHHLAPCPLHGARLAAAARRPDCSSLVHLSPAGERVNARILGRERRVRACVWRAPAGPCAAELSCLASPGSLQQSRALPRNCNCLTPSKTTPGARGSSHEQ